MGDRREGHATILVTDLEGSTELTVRLGDEAAQRLVDEHLELVRRNVVAGGGRVLKTMGDGALAAFGSARAAMGSAVAIQRDQHAGDERLRVRIGLDAGDVILTDDDIHGAAVAVANRVNRQACGGQVLATGVVVQLAGTMPDVEVRKREPVQLKGVAEPVVLYEVAWEAEPASPPPPPPPSDTTIAALIVGRDAELAVGRRAVDEAAAGTARLVLVSGEPGIGKTSVAEELATYARSLGFVVLWGAGWEGGAAPPFWPWSQALRDLAGTPVRDRALTELGPLRSDVAAVFPELAGAGDGVRQFTDELRFRAFDAFVSFLREVSRRKPLAVVLDDLHWADPSSLELLRFVVRSTRHLNMVIVATYRDVEVSGGHPLAGVLPDVSSDAVRLGLSGLGPLDVARLVEMTIGREATAHTVDQVVDRTAGNPLFVKELSRLLQLHPEADAEVPAGVREVLARRLGRLTPETQRLLAVAAVAGTTVYAFVVATVGRTTRTAALDALDEAARARLVLAGGRPEEYRFAHALVRETLYIGLPPSERTRLHGLVGVALETRSGDEPLAELANHFSLAGLEHAERAVGFAEAAGHQALSRFAYEQADRLFFTALDLLRAAAPDDHGHRAELLLARAEACRRASDPAIGRAVSEEAAALARRVRNPTLLGRAALAHASQTAWAILSWAGSDPSTVALIEEALRALPADDSALRARLMLRLAQSYEESQQHDRAMDLIEGALAMARRVDDPTATLEALEALMATLPPWKGDVLGVVEELSALGHAQGSLEAMMAAEGGRLWHHLSTADRSEIERAIRTASAMLREVKIPTFDCYPDLWAAMLALADGRVADAEPLVLGTVSKLAGLGNEFLLGLAMNQLLLLRWQQGRGDELLGMARMALASRPIPAERAGLALLEAEYGDRDAARALLAELCADGCATSARNTVWPTGWYLLSLTAMHLGDHERMVELYDLGLPLAGVGIVTGVGTFALGSVDQALGALAIRVGPARRSRPAPGRGVGVRPPLPGPWLHPSDPPGPRRVVAGARRPRTGPPARHRRGGRSQFTRDGAHRLAGSRLGGGGGRRRCRGCRRC